MLSGMFFASGYLMSRGLIYAQMPKRPKAKRTVSLDIPSIPPSGLSEELSMDEGSDFSKDQLGNLMGLAKSGVARKPSEAALKKQQEPYFPEEDVPARTPSFPQHI